MKRVIVIPLIAVAAILSVLFLPGKGLSETVEITEVKTGDFQYRKEVSAAVNGQSHQLYFPGNIIEVSKNEGEEIRKSETILTYVDAYGNKKRLTSSVSGMIVRIENGMVTVKDLNLYLYCQIDLETRNRLSVGSTHMFTSAGKHYHASVISLPKLGFNQNNRLMFEIILDIEDKGDLLIGQSGILTLDLGSEKSVLLVEKKALLNDGKGYYLLEKGYVEDPKNMEKYRLNVEVLNWDETRAVIRGTGLEAVEVCIFSDDLKELIDAS
ncbi:MAG: hypothetical protein IJM15_09260 [Erysipelotrichaceae bacterium]|nr:hypothetical protein [Erysipelotrichaceae bacterium]